MTDLLSESNHSHWLAAAAAAATGTMHITPATLSPSPRTGHVPGKQLQLLVPELPLPTQPAHQSPPPPPNSFGHQTTPHILVSSPRDKKCNCWFFSVVPRANVRKISYWTGTSPRPDRTIHGQYQLTLLQLCHQTMKSGTHARSTQTGDPAAHQ